MRESRSSFASGTATDAWNPSEADLRQVTECLSILAVLVALRCQSAACSMAGCLNNGDEMRPTFAILVTHADKPMAGVTFHIVAKGTERFSGITDEHGTVHVGRLAPGEYWLNGDLLGTGVVYTCFHVSVKPSRREKRKLSYAWGDEAPSTTRIEGILIDSQPGKGGTPIWNLIHRIDVPIIGASLKVQDPITGAAYVARSDQNGKFSFEALPNGTYVIHIEGGMASDRGYDATDKVISIDASATRNWLEFKRRDGGAGSCGGTELELQRN